MNSMQIKEIWKPVAGYEELYAVSDLGRIKSLNYNRTGVEKVLKPMKTKGGYLLVYLFRDGKGKKFLVHRLVATAFIPNPMGLPEVNHKDEDKINNVVGNLEFCSRRYNINYGSHNKRMAAARSKVVEASKYPDFRAIELCFASTKEAGLNGYSQGAVSCCCNRCYNREGNNKYKGLFWRFAS